MARRKRAVFPWSSTATFEVIFMNMDEVIARINELAKKAKTEGLNEEELEERAKLRRIYIDSVKASLTGHLENTYLVDPDGTKHKLQHK